MQRSIHALAAYSLLLFFLSCARAPEHKLHSMLHYLTGDLLQAKTQALVNAVGVIGKGIALQFKEGFPHNNKVYVQACKKKELAPGKLLGVWGESLGAS
jgi:hypothetical protein